MLRICSLTALAALALGLPRLAAAQSSKSAGEEAVVAMVQSYHQAVEAKDETALREDVYHGEIPGENRRFLRALFDRTEQLDLALETRELRVELDRAVAVIDCTINFRHATTGERKTAHYSLRLIFEPDASGWRLKKFERV
jgi:ketosteroid isomerase-like protein